MTHVVAKLTPAEAALVACVSVRDVNRLYDEKLLPAEMLTRSFTRENHDRYVWAWACVIIAFYFGTAEQLKKPTRLKAIRAKASDVDVLFSKFITPFLIDDIYAAQFTSHIREPKKSTYKKEIDNLLTYEDDLLRIDWEPVVCNVKERWKKLLRAKSMVETSSGILGGTPVITGTRVPVYDVAASVEKGIAIEDILEAYPSITREQVDLAAFYAKAVPPRGRPKTRELPEGTKIIVQRRVPRRSGVK